MGTDIGTGTREAKLGTFHGPQKNTICLLFPKKLLHNPDKSRDERWFEGKLLLKSVAIIYQISFQ